MSYPTYTDYIDSGVDWLGEIPKGWTVLSIKRFTNIKRGASPRPIGDPIYFDDEGEYAWVRISDVTASDLYLKRTTQRLSRYGKLFSVPLEPGDLFLSIAGSVGKPIIAAIKACIHDGFVYFKDLKQNHRFLYYIFKSGKPYLGLGKLGTQLNLNIETVGGIKVAIPSNEEQTAIANFLDHETAKIDHLISKQQQLANLLKEKLDALVHEAMSMQGSRTVRIAAIANLINRPTKRLANKFYIPIGLYNRGRGIFHKDTCLGSELGDSDFFWVKEGDLVLSGQFAWEGSIALAKEEDEGCIVSHRYPILRGKHKVAETPYIFAFLATKHGDFLLNENSRGAAGRNRPLNIGSLMKEKIFLPPLPAQKRISKLISTQRAICNTIEQQKNLLQERRTALISAAVTGKIDVRNLAKEAA